MTKLKEERISDEKLDELIGLCEQTDKFPPALSALRELKSLRHPWVSVKEALPEIGAVVWLWIIGAGGEGYKITGGRVDGDDGWLWGVSQHTYWLDDPTDIEADDDYNVTHWMPLPPAPEGE